MIAKAELLRWLATVPEDAMVGIDEGGLMLVTDDTAYDGFNGPYLEIGGMDEPHVTTDECRSNGCKECRP